MTKEFIPYEQALQLKELGFNIKPNFGGNTSLYSKNGYHTFYTNYGVMGSGLSDGYIYAPTFSQAFRFFREKYNIIAYTKIYIIRDGVDEYHYEIKIDKIRLHMENPYSINTFKTYEEAELACLIKLIELVKQNKKD
jgi:hypothetical protein